MRDDDRGAEIAADANFLEERYFAEKGHAFAFGFGAPAAVAENLDAFAAGGGEVAHVLNDPEDGHVNLFKHGHAFADNAERGLLRRGHDHTAVEGDGLAQG